MRVISVSLLAIFSYVSAVAAQTAFTNQNVKPPASSSPFAQDSTELEPTNTPNAKYPDEAARRNIQGQVIVRVVVSESGDVALAQIVSGNPVLGVAAIHAANNWKFRPFIKNGKPVKAATKLVFSFMINGVNLYTWNDATLGPDGKPPMLVAPTTADQFIIRKVAPVYPSFAVSLGIQGVVELHVLIDEDGKPKKVTAVSGRKELVGAATDAVKQWRWKAYIVDGKPVQAETVVTVIFQRHA